MFLFVIIWFMYVVEGNIDVDSVKVDDKKIYYVMDQWGYV